jgi:GMP synthase (glutamine-hydrolysing)
MGKVVTGVCLGAQLIAKAMGAEVRNGNRQEIGWFPVNIHKQAADKAGFEFLPREMTVFHWHGDTFEIPAGAIHLASSEAFANQAFLYKDRVLALQFHFEMNNTAIESILNNVAEELIPAAFVQTRKEILANIHYLPENNKIMYKILDKLEKMLDA